MERGYGLEYKSCFTVWIKLRIAEFMVLKLHSFWKAARVYWNMGWKNEEVCNFAGGEGDIMADV